MDGKQAYGNMKKFIQSLSPIMDSWDAAKSLFLLKKTEGALQERAEQADLGLAWKIFILGSILSAVFWVIALAEEVEVTNFSAKTISEEFGIVQQVVPMESIMTWVPFYLIVWIPLVLVLMIGTELPAYKIIRLTGGKGSFAQHMHLASIVSLGLGMVNVLTLIFPIYCVNYLAVIAWAIGIIYLMVYGTTRTYMAAHKITLVHALTVAILIAGIRMAAAFFAISWLMAALNLGF